jgi:hypothetical protein
MRQFLNVFFLLMLVNVPTLAQDALDLPAPLYVLLNEGRVQRYGRGAEGISLVTPEEVFIVDFGVSPNGSWLAYRTETDLIVQDIADGTTRTIDSGSAGAPSVRGQGETVAWSPAGDAIAVTSETGARVYLSTLVAPPDSVVGMAYNAVELTEGAFLQVMWSPDGGFLAAEAAGNIWWIYRREANTLALHSVIIEAAGAAFVNNNEIVFAPLAGGLSLMNLTNANAQTTLLDDTWSYRLPYLLPDGMLAVFGRQKVDTEIAENQGRLLGLTAGVAEIAYLSEVPLMLDNLRWATGGDWLVTFEGGVFSLIDPLTGTTFALPVTGAVAYTWGPLPATSE